MQAARAPRVYQWLTYDDNDARKAQRSHKDVLELNEDGWVENDPRFVAQDMSNFKYHVWDDIASFLAWYEDVEAVRRHYSEWIRGDQHQKLRFDFDLEYTSEVDHTNALNAFNVVMAGMAPVMRELWGVELTPAHIHCCQSKLHHCRLSPPSLGEEGVRGTDSHAWRGLTG